MQIRVTFSSNYYKHNYSSDIPKYYYISDKNVLKKSLKKTIETIYSYALTCYIKLRYNF